MKPALISVEEFGRWLGIGRSLAWALVSANVVESVHVGRSRRVVVSSAEAYLASLRDKGPVK